MRQKNYRIWLFFTLGVYLSMLFGSIYHGMIGEMPMYEIVANSVLSGMIAYLLDHAVKYIQLKRNRRLQDKIWFVVLFFLANAVLAQENAAAFGYLWMLPVIMAAMCSGAEQGGVVFAALLAQKLLLEGSVFSTREMLIVVLFGVVCIWLVLQKLSMQVLPYIGLIMLACSGILQILRYRFLFDRMQEHVRVIVGEEISVVILFGFLCFYYWYREQKGKTREEDLVIQRRQRKQLSNILEADYGLLLRLQEYSGKLFIHSMKISSVSAQAARHMGGNVQLAQAGGLYHEIGRITGEKDYVAAGVRLAEENDFPENLIEVIKQHSTGYENPKTLEATIVMFTDSIISTSDYLEQKGKRKAISDKQLVESIFEHRISNGILAESGLDEAAIERLKQFYIRQYFMA